MIPPRTFSNFALDDRQLNLASSSALSGLVCKLIFDCIKSKRDEEKQTGAQQAPWASDLQTRLEELWTYIVTDSTFVNIVFSSIQFA